MARETAGVMTGGQIHPEIGGKFTGGGNPGGAVRLIEVEYFAV